MYIFAIYIVIYLLNTFKFFSLTYIKFYCVITISKKIFIAFKRLHIINLIFYSFYQSKNTLKMQGKYLSNLLYYITLLDEKNNLWQNPKPLTYITKIQNNLGICNEHHIFPTFASSYWITKSNVKSQYFENIF